jgi:hypothetical protein
MAERGDEVWRKTIEVLGSAIQRRTSRRGFLSKVAKVGAVAAAGPIYSVLTAPNASAIDCLTCSVDPNGQCASFTTSIFCCSISGGSNVCPSNTRRSGWWRCNDTDPAICPSSVYRYYIDCNADPGQCACDCPNGCAGHPSCKFDREYVNCNPDVNLGKIKCRIVRCTNPGSLWPAHCDTAGGTLSDLDPACNCNATCAC